MKPNSKLVSFFSATAILLVSSGCASIGRKHLFYPTHRPADDRLNPWIRNGEPIGFSREVPSPENIWLMLHGNGGQASDRAYALPRFSTDDSVYIVEYPGYGSRKGAPSKAALDRAAREAYLLLREIHPRIPVCVVGESIGSGPASHLATLDPPPDKVVLVVPFQKLSKLAREHAPPILVGLLMRENWDNSKSLSRYRGPIDIFGAKGDTLIPVAHARALAADLPGSKFFPIEGGHNTWSHGDRVRIRNP